MIEYYAYEISLDIFNSGKGFYLYRVNHATKSVQFIRDRLTGNPKSFISILDLMLYINNRYTWCKSGITYESFLNQKDKFNIIDLHLED